ncbi:ferredoxin-type protein NapH [Catalinimonas alkaloidigena]|uniref:4Fe-4S binding protein n=1 Tax=Catalinimonas alkaloidigena TaxID=1075417 RepID=UPI002406DA6B|nr:4Fe-4S dicluster domain-containing protein [Catalinimonas alkaloidigena]MDF9801210.1 ferredoxin-type protein NapH [Catalinimonas alkaloidigena]
MNRVYGIRLFGLLIFLLGFGLFVGIFFMSDYELDQKVLKQELATSNEASSPNAAQPETEQTDQEGETSKSGGSLYHIVLEEAQNMISKTYETNFAFVDDLNAAWDAANIRVRDLYGIGDEEVSRIVSEVAANDLTYTAEVVKNTLKREDEATSLKREKLLAYTGFLEGKQFGSEEELKSQLQKTVASVNNDIAGQKGISRYRKKSLNTSVVKASTKGLIKENTLLILLLSIGLSILGALMYILPHAKEPAGIRHNGIFFSAMKNRGWIGILLGTFLILFYIVLYFYPYYMTNWIILADPISYWLKGSPAGEFFLYGFLYTLAILVMGVRMFIKYRHSNYHLIRTSSVMFFQLAFAFLLPEILIRLNYPYYDFKNIWPLDYDFFFPSSLNQLIQAGGLGTFMLFWGIILIVVAVPVLVYFYGKRWYCSWVCGCGGLAETLGDPYRQLSDKSLKAWRIERWMVHGVLLFAVLMTIGMIYTFFTESGSLLGIPTYSVAEFYGFFIGAGFAGVIGTGFYPLMGNRVWCRFGCPLAAYLGIVQRFKSRFRITTNGGQCISCGNCSTYCEMGIDVRWYAQRGQNIVRASCVGCGVCSSVCPRGVLKLENGKEEGRFGKPILIGNDSVKVDA